MSIAQANAEAAFRGLNWAAATPRLLRDRLSRALVLSLDQFGEAVKSVTAAMGGSCPESSFAATLIVVVFRPPWLLAVNIGDGFVVARRATEQMLMVSRPYVSSVDASTVTTALSARAMANASLIFLYDPELSGFAASTDGLQDISLEWDRTMPSVPHAEFFGPFFSGVADGSLTSAHLARFLHQKRIADEAADDLTLVAMVYGSED